MLIFHSYQLYTGLLIDQFHHCIAVMTVKSTPCINQIYIIFNTVSYLYTDRCWNENMHSFVESLTYDIWATLYSLLQLFVLQSSFHTSSSSTKQKHPTAHPIQPPVSLSKQSSYLPGILSSVTKPTAPPAVRGSASAQWATASWRQTGSWWALCQTLTPSSSTCRPSLWRMMLLIPGQ